MDQLICASLSHTHYSYEVGMLKVPAGYRGSIVPGSRIRGGSTNHRIPVTLSLMLVISLFFG